MMNNIPIEIRRLTKAKVSLASELPPEFAAYMLGYEKENYSRKWRVRQLHVSRYKCAPTNYNKRSYTSQGMMSDNTEDKIQFIIADLNKESLDDVLLSLKMHLSGYV